MIGLVLEIKIEFVIFRFFYLFGSIGGYYRVFMYVWEELCCGVDDILLVLIEGLYDKKGISFI